MTDNQRRQFPFQIFSVAYICAMFFPRTVTEGMFFDGLYYANIARHIGAGYGGLWNPQMIVAYDHMGMAVTEPFYGHPALGMWLSSFGYRLFGDHLFVEKAICILVWATSAWLIARIWRAVSSHPEMWHLPLMVWYGMPMVVWSYPSLMLDNLMGVFCLLASYFLLSDREATGKGPAIKGAASPVRFMAISHWLAVAFCHAAFLTKGPVGLYPLAIPAIWSFVFPENGAFKKGIGLSAFLIFLTAASLGCWFFYAPAREFWLQYFHAQIMSSITVNEQTVSYSWKNYLMTPIFMLQSVIPIAAAALIFYIFSKAKRAIFRITEQNKRYALLYLLIFLSGSAPMVISHKTSAYYLIPSVPFMALSFSALLEDTFAEWAERYRLSSAHSLNVRRFLWALCLALALYTAMRIGAVGREKALIADLRLLHTVIPAHTNVGAPQSIYKDETYIAYFTRYDSRALLSLQKNFDFAVFPKNESPDAHFLETYRRVNLQGLRLLDLYQQKRE